MNGRKEILVIDDEPGHRTVINKKLKTAGYHTVLAQNAQEALVALWEKEQIGVVILDVRLPVINGMNIFEIIRKEFPDKKIIISSALQKEEQQFLIIEADDYYYKSEDLSCLAEKVDRVLNNRLSGSLRQNEKRDFKRMPVNILAACERDSHYAPGNFQNFISYTKDLSLHGGRFVIGDDIQVGQHFSVSLELPVNFLPLLIDCEVVWVKRIGERDPQAAGNLEIGVKFVKLDSPRDEENLRNYLNCV